MLIRVMFREKAESKEPTWSYTSKDSSKKRYQIRARNKETTGRQNPKENETLKKKKKYIF